MVSTSDPNYMSFTSSLSSGNDVYLLSSSSYLFKVAARAVLRGHKQGRGLIRRPATVDGTFLRSRRARVKNPTFLRFLEPKCVKRTLISTEFYLRTVPHVHFRLNETPILDRSRRQRKV